ncbi:hypothetical protein [Frankia sp. CcI49]|uniref:hypothetical protein n=1 Tax=Frankia sp. CcI49 TaxID=1745382 RepID=UPI0010548C90|nr:hypothetical protein [Frankia sp. CcI49]
MSSTLRLLALRIRTHDGWQEPYNLDAPLVALVGPVDRGKSSMLDCVAFAFGRDIREFRGAVEIQLVEVEVTVRIGSGVYRLNRSRFPRSSEVEIFDASGTPEGSFGLKDRGEKQSLSDWILERLGMDDRISAVRLPGDRRLTFADDVFSYCYLVQQDIDRHIVRPQERDTERRVVLKLLLNLTTAEYERTSGAVRDLRNKIRRLRRNMDLIRGYVDSSDVTNVAVVEQRLVQLRGDESVADADLAALKSDARLSSSFADKLRTEVMKARISMADAEYDLDGLRWELGKSENALREIVEALAHLEERDGAASRDSYRLHQIEALCPACSSSVDRNLPGRCYLCAQDLPEFAIKNERRRLEKRREDEDVRKRGLLLKCESAFALAEGAKIELHRLNEALKAKLLEIPVSPRVDEIADAAARLAAIRREIEVLEKIRSSHSELQRRDKEIENCEKEEKELLEQLHLAEAELEPIARVIDNLNSDFRAVVDGMDLPHATGQARIDPSTLLPLVDEQNFGQRGGGARAAVSIGYSLALLTYALGNSISLLPGLLMIDSPQKNFGANEYDTALAHRVYSQFLDYVDARYGSRLNSLDRPYQLIVVDNHIPKDMRHRFMMHDLSNGFIRNLANPHRRPESTDVAGLWSDDMSEE